MSFSIYDLEMELLAHAATLDVKVEQETMKVIREAAHLAAIVARKKTGDDARSIEDSPRVTSEAGRITGEWGSTTDYGPFQEYGTGRRGAAGTSERDTLPPGWVHGDISGISPRWHHRFAFRTMEPVYVRRMTALGGLP